MDHYKGGKVLPCVLGGVAVGAGLAVAAAHLWVPSWCKKSTKAPKEITLTYFNIEGAAEKVRLALTLQGVPFTDKRIAFDQWQTLKPTTKYGQLPLMVVDGEEYAQSLAMLQWAGALGDASLYPEGHRLEIDEVVGLAMDFDKEWMPAFYMGMFPAKFGYPEDFNKTEEGTEVIKKMRTKFVEGKMKELLNHYTAHLRKRGNGFFCGSTVTIADCLILPQLRRFTSGNLDHVPADCLDTHPEVKAWMSRMLALPKVAAWYAASH